jgi:hypothetical protein
LIQQELVLGTLAITWWTALLLQKNKISISNQKDDNQ